MKDLYAKIHEVDKMYAGPRFFIASSHVLKASALYM